MASRKRKHLSRAHRAAISKGLKRHYRQERVKAQRRSAAAKRAALTRAAKVERKAVRRGARKVRQLETVAAKPLRKVAPAPVTEEWEVTIRYQKEGQLVAVSVVVFVPNPLPDGSQPTAELVKGAAWRASRGQHNSIMTVQAVNWRREATSRTGRTKVYENEGAEVDLQAFYYMMRKATLFRAERIAD